MSAGDTYLDTSAILPYYREEAKSSEVERVLMSLSVPVTISDLCKVEFASALSRWVRMGELTEGQASLIQAAFDKDIGTGLYLQTNILSSHFRLAEQWISRRKTSLRTLDAIHLACSHTMNKTIITCDHILSQAAGILGIKFIHI
jgi:uncharacterized protein